VTFAWLRRSLSGAPLAAALLLCSFGAKADTLTGGLSFFAPQGPVPTGPHPAATGRGSFSFSSDLTNGLTQNGTLHVLASDLISFNFTVTTNAVSTFPAITGPAATYTFGLADLTSIDITVFRNGSSGFFSPGLQNIATAAVAGSIPDYGLGTFSGSSGIVSATFSVSIFPYPGFPNGNDTVGGLAVTNDGVLTASTTAIPEPASFLLAAPALAGLWFLRRKKAA